MLSKTKKADKRVKTVLIRKENAMQLLVGSGFSECEYRTYYPSTNNQIYSCKV